MEKWIWIPVILGVIIVIVFSIILGLKQKLRSQDFTFTSFFLSKERISDHEMVATLAATNTALALIVFWFSYLGWFYGLGMAFWLFLFWVIGLEVFAQMQKKWNDYPGKMAEQHDDPKYHTLHEYIADNKSDWARRSLALVSIITFLLMMTVELTRGMRVFDVVNSANDKSMSDSLALIVLLSISVYSAIGGYKAVIVTDKYQLLFCFFAILISFIIAVHGIWGEKNLFGSIYSPSDFTFSNFFLLNEPYLIIGSLFSWSFWFIVTMDMWQRASASRKIQLVTIKTRMYLYPWFLFLTITSVCIGAFTRVYFPGDSSITFPTVNFLEKIMQNFALYPIWGGILLIIIFVGFISAMLSTLDTYFIAVTQSILRDLPTSVDVRKFQSKAFSRGVPIFVVIGISLSIYPIYLLVTHSKFSINTLLYLATSAPFILLVPILFKKINTSYSIILSCLLGFIGLFIIITFLLTKLSTATADMVGYWYNWLYISPLFASFFSLIGFLIGKNIKSR
ncbi:MAG: hypothetical protein HXY50_11485 [Ignavibacteriaceae bacterium]|nr:hypothetical protein [Ignavibacteriaceae bacterium]